MDNVIENDCAIGFSNLELSSFEKQLSSLLNRYSMENGSNTPDFILANYLHKCLENFNETSKAREKWYGKSLSIGGGSVPIDPQPDFKPIEPDFFDQ